MKLRRLCQYLWYVLLDGYRKSLSASFVEDCIPGRYVSEVKTSSGMIRGTLTISCLSSSGNVYGVSYDIDELTESGNVQQTKNTYQESWLAYYDHRLRHLVETNLDKMVSFIPEKRVALYGVKMLEKVAG